MAAGVGWDVEALGMAAVVAMVFLTAGPEVAECLADKVCCVYVWPHGARAGRRQISVRPNAAELVRAKRAVRVVDDGKRGRWWRMELRTWRGSCGQRRGGDVTVVRCWYL